MVSAIPAVTPEELQALGSWGFLRRFVSQIHWADEPWLLALLGFHALTFGLIVLFRRRQSVQAVIFILTGVLVMLSERLNELGALHWQEFSTEQYFDSAGLFTTFVLALPGLCNCLLVLVLWLREAWALMASVKRLRVTQQCKAGPGAGAPDSPPCPSTSTSIGDGTAPPEVDAGPETKKDL